MNNLSVSSFPAKQNKPMNFNQNSQNNQKVSLTFANANGNPENPTKTMLHVNDKLANPGNPGNPSQNKNKESKLLPEPLKKQRLKLDDKGLFYSENGVKKLYDVVNQTEFKQTNSDVSNLNKLVQIFKNWHFMLFPKYDIDFFINKVSDIGKKPSGRAYMSRLRKIYKGDENWDVIYNDQDQILANPTKKTGETSKTFQEDANDVNSLDNTNNITNNTNKTGIPLNFSNVDSSSNPVNRISNKFSHVSLTQNNKNLTNIDNDNKEETDANDLFFRNVDEVNEKDYENFDHFFDNDNVSMSKGNDNENFSVVSVSEVSVKYKHEKRNFNTALGRDPSVEGENLHDAKETKKMKLD